MTTTYIIESEEKEQDEWEKYCQDVLNPSDYGE